ncbi:MAG: hypothetical protein A3G33_10680 [Omnitrophica bacterium RIFCSPLOWO2_12_FULL_44_17]|uniref:Uncharacterized protein n=1 Tax=Candidatus Danuiimicrobium aquiferis TaxID=1801832 RepID=A0A1G1KR62_9BACT|nr:MAG: hypothetical protein A3B72_03000 [Omnitrophica bacterium RIFCSPHIGHO2_02_FULL_45_28]OGW95434.1 MAG: hypothetical protein A3G33_10680 [Omnitrophica bacterium RIFCSPLOWO2_12_FULL_44_17]OGX03314.1 MAG: hypothetical protein A3J12_07315 [Omnitrophica bacterium RIFCSPLOWO2_02_FULL_44_11]
MFTLGKARAGPVFPGKRASAHVRHKALADPPLAEIPAFPPLKRWWIRPRCLSPHNVGDPPTICGGADAGMTKKRKVLTCIIFFVGLPRQWRDCGQ